MIKGKNILLGVCGGIAAYKSAYIIRLLVKAGAGVKVIQTPESKNFIAPLTFATLSKNLVFCDSHNKDTGEWYSHIELTEWADVLLIAPATANTIAKMVAGIADNLLLTTYLSAICPVVVAPAMDLNMYKHPATKSNIEVLKNRGHYVIDAQEGELASGLCGEGRMAEPEDIVFLVNKFLS